MTDEQIDDWIATLADGGIHSVSITGREKLHKFARAIYRSNAAQQEAAQPNSELLNELECILRWVIDTRLGRTLKNTENKPRMLEDLYVAHEKVAALRGSYCGPKPDFSYESAQPAPMPVAKVTSYDPLNYTGTVEWLPALNGVPRQGFEVGALLCAAIPPSQPEREKNAEWLLVSEHGNPEEGLYVAMYRDGDSMPVALLPYGDYEYYSESESEGDENGLVQGFGWSEEVDTTGEWASLIYVRDVIAYQPINYDVKSLATVRAAIAASQSGGKIA